VPARPFEDFLVEQLEVVARPRGVPLEGDYVEFGVYVGTSMAAAVRAFDRVGVARSRFVGFDSFEGLPPGSEQDGWTSGAFAASRSVAEWNLARQGVRHRVELVEGWFDVTCTEQTVERLGLGNVLVAMIDCDTYSSSRVALDFVEPLLAPQALVIFDDWYARNPEGTELEGQRRAFHELVARRPDLVIRDAGRPGFYGQAFRVMQPEALSVAPPSSGATLV
jgi:O-methyltransferase